MGWHLFPATYAINKFVVKECVLPWDRYGGAGGIHDTEGNEEPAKYMVVRQLLPPNLVHC